MALLINGVEPTNIKVDENGTVTDLINLNIYKGDKLLYNWHKTYKLSISNGSTSTVSVGVKSSEYASITDRVYNGSAIKHGSYLDITVNANQGYNVTWKLNGVTQYASHVTTKVTGNVTITVTETAVVQKLNSPVISGSYTYDSYGGYYFLTCQIKNSNDKSVSANIMVYSNGGQLRGSDTITISANSTITYPYGELYSTGAKATVTFSCDGYGNSTATMTFGDYDNSGDSDDETTTTTSTR